MIKCTGCNGHRVIGHADPAWSDGDETCPFCNGSGKMEGMLSVPTVKASSDGVLIMIGERQVDISSCYYSASINRSDILSIRLFEDEFVSVRIDTSTQTLTLYFQNRDAELIALFLIDHGFEVETNKP